MRKLRAGQRGYADGLVGLITLMVYGLIALWGLAVVVSLAVPMIVLRGYWRVAVVAAIAIAWAGAYQHTIRGPAIVEQKARDWQGLVWASCQAERTQLPALVVDGFLDEGASLRKDVVLQFFAERELAFIEVRPRPGPRITPISATPEGGHESHWEGRRFNTPYARLELGERGQAGCIDLLGRHRDILRLPPFLPDTCLVLKPVAQPAARIALTLVPASPEAEAAGRWRLSDRQTQQMLAELSTTEAFPSAGADQRLSRPEDPPRDDCRSPQMILADRLYGTALERPPAADVRVLRQRRINGAAGLAEQGATADVARIVVEPVRLKLTEEERRQRFSQSMSDTDWRDTVEVARRDGFSSSGQRLLRWADRTLISLDLGQSRPGGFGGTIKAVDDGFIAFQWERGADSQRSPWRLIRFTPRGEFLWAVVVERSGPSHPVECAHFTPDAAYTDAGALVLLTICGEAWRIPLSALPDRGRGAGFRAQPPAAAIAPPPRSQ